MKQLTIIAAIFIILSVFSFLIYKGCGKEPRQADTWRAKYDSLVSVIDDKDKEIKKLDELVTYYAQQYEESAKDNDSLRASGVKVITKYKEVKIAGDTVKIIEACDSLANEYGEFIEQTDLTLKKVDSLVNAQYSKIDAQGTQIENYKALVKGLEEELARVRSDLEKWKKLAKRRGRAVEW